MDNPKTGINTFFKLKKPCKNCPCRKEGAIELSEGRLKSILEEQLDDDRAPFFCHKTVNYGNYNDDDYNANGEESYCVGVMNLLQQLNRPNLAMRLGYIIGALDKDELDQLTQELVDPVEVLKE